MNDVPIFFDMNNIDDRKKTLYGKIKQEEEEKNNQKSLKDRAKKEMIIIKPLLEKRNEKHGEPIKSISIMDELNEFLTTITDSSNNNTK